MSKSKERTGGGGVTATQSLFQEEDGGSSPTSPHNFWIEEAEFNEIRHVLERFHYKGGHIGGSILFNLKVLWRDRVVGGAVMGPPRHEENYPDSIDIRRLATEDWCPKNTESWFLSKIAWYVNKKNENDYDYLLTYSDPSAGHDGTIYKAANFERVGETDSSRYILWDGERYHPRSLSIDRDYSDRLNEALDNGEAKIINSEPKKIWKYNL